MLDTLCYKNRKITQFMHEVFITSLEFMRKVLFVSCEQ